MVKHYKILYLLASVIVSIYFINTFGASIIYTENHNMMTGPGVLPVEKVIPIVTESVKTNIEIASASTLCIDAVYEHDGIKYVKGECAGNFSLTGYCACNKCGTGTGITASGRKVRENHTVAADWSVLPKYTMIILENAVGKDGTVYDGVYQVEDRGGGVKNNHLDIYRPTHDLAALVTYHGKCYGDVYIAVPVSTDSDIK